ncbi:polysaccharide biosynthesis/export family protein [Massilia sp. CF038]|uniref:polysaccharide biosynthesis/export family protein n=1 Tax=Massilia sp. CF038 TaxID=1881045 RepID=UPI0009109B5C|nr:polysaccharide biosynthesis/export family protein [Massilia sp. CF038]SHH02740.1 polysaccharide export outer membrane protein [Massilia sp. CF038]
MKIPLREHALRGLSLILLACCLTACASRPMSRQSGLPAEPGGPATQLITEQLIEAERRQRELHINKDIAHLVVPTPPPYTIGSGDLLSIVVWDHPELAGQGIAAASNPMESPAPAPAGFVVDHEGRVQFPFAGELTVAGLTEEQARMLLTRRLARYIASPNVTLRVQAYRSKRVYIDGEVRQPGLQAINDIPMTLTEALNRAGGVLPTADQSRIALERGGTRYLIDLRALVASGINPGNVMLAHGDLVRVHSRDESKVFVSGEVVAPKALTMHDGRLTLNEALGESGGISPLTGDARQIYVVRKSSEGTRVFQLDARQAGALAMAESFELHPKDLVYVAASSLANWHRNLSMIFPGALTQAVSASRP